MNERIDSIQSYFPHNLKANCTSVGVAETTKLNSFKVYPNPFNDLLTINYEAQTADVSVTIYNVVGEKVLRRAINSINTELNLASLNRGVYFLQISDGELFFTKKVIHQ